MVLVVGGILAGMTLVGAQQWHTLILGHPAGRGFRFPEWSQWRLVYETGPARYPITHLSTHTKYLLNADGPTQLYGSATVASGLSEDKTWINWVVTNRYYLATRVTMTRTIRLYNNASFDLIDEFYLAPLTQVEFQDGPFDAARAPSKTYTPNKDINNGKIRGHGINAVFEQLEFLPPGEPPNDDLADLEDRVWDRIKGIEDDRIERERERDQQLQIALEREAERRRRMAETDQQRWEQEREAEQKEREAERTLADLEREWDELDRLDELERIAGQDDTEEFDWGQELLDTLDDAQGSSDAIDDAYRREMRRLRRQGDRHDQTGAGGRCARILVEIPESQALDAELLKIGDDSRAAYRRCIEQEQRRSSCGPGTGRSCCGPGDGPSCAKLGR